MRYRALLLTAVASVVLAQCTPNVPMGRKLDPLRVVISPHPWPTPLALPPDAPPRILAVWMNEAVIPTGSDWFGRIVASTNTASLEIRTESFSFIATRTTFGDFTFRQHVLDMVPQYRRDYSLLIIARNSAGIEDRVVVPISFK